MTRFAFVFPGQGSQSTGMMASYAEFPVVRDTFSEASDILQQDFWQLITAGTPADLNATLNTQPLMLTAGIAVYRAWQSMQGARPVIMAGHSLGEYTALVAADALDFAEALPLVRYRAQCMQEAVPEGIGGIAAILGLPDDEVHALCIEGAQGEVLEAVNFNSPGQVVIAGNRGAVERGMAIAKVKGAKRAVMLPMSVPSHCSLLKGAAKRLDAYLKDVSVRPPSIPVVHNADVTTHDNAAAIKDALVRQLFSPVRWVETIRFFGGQGVSHNVECGPGRVLVGLNKRIDMAQQALALDGGEALKAATAVLA